MKITFKSVQEVNQFFQSWHDYDESVKLQTLRELKELGKITPLSTRPNPEVSQCPKYSFSLSRPCSLSNCQFYMNAAEAKNCVISCLNNSKLNRLTANEVSDLTRLSLSEVNEITQKSTNKIKRAILKEKISGKSLVKYKFLPKHCLNCEMSIVDELDMCMNPNLRYDTDGNYGWCSEECKKEYPGWKFSIENEFECDYLDVLTIACSSVQAKPGNQKDLIQKVSEILDIEPSYIFSVWERITNNVRSMSY